MSNEMSLEAMKFHISPANEEAARAALAKLAASRVGTINWRAGDIQEMVEGRGCNVSELTIDELLQCWGWRFIRDIANQTDEINGIDLFEDFASDEETLFETLAPFVTAGSFIDLEGKNTSGYWQTRHGFTGKRVVELERTCPPCHLTRENEAEIKPVEMELPATATEISARALAYAQQHGCGVAIWVKGTFTGVNPSIGRHTFDHWQRVVGLESATGLTLTLALGNSGLSIPMWINGPGRLRLAPEEKKMDRLNYSLAFEAIDPFGALQTDPNKGGAS